MPRTLSESDSKRLLLEYGIDFPLEVSIRSTSEIEQHSDNMSFPVAAKLCGDGIAHKTERGLVRLNIESREALTVAVDELFGLGTHDDGDISVLIAPMILGTRELICGMSRDEQFGPAVLLGVGGVMAEVIDDVVVRLCPITRQDANEMMDSLEMAAMLGEFRGEPPLDRPQLVSILMGLSRAAMADNSIRSIDLNPLIVSNGSPIAVDALVERTS